MTRVHRTGQPFACGCFGSNTKKQVGPFTGLLPTLLVIALSTLMLCQIQPVKAEDIPGETIEQRRIKRIPCNPYRVKLERYIRRHWIAPRLNHSTKTVLSYYITSDGKISDITITSASGDADMDKSTIEAIERSSPYKPFPSVCQVDRLHAEIVFERIVQHHKYIGPLP